MPTDVNAIKVQGPDNGSGNPILVSYNGLAAAAALADDTTNPSTVLNGACLLGFDGTTWDRIRAGSINNLADAVGLLNALAAGRYDSTPPTLTTGRFNPVQLDQRGAAHVAIYGPDSTVGVDVLGNEADGLTNNRNIMLAEGRQYRFNESGWDRERGNTESELLASAARTTDASTADQVMYNGRGVLLVLEVTANPGGAQTLQMRVELRGTASTRVYAANTANAFGGAAGFAMFLLYPGAVETIADANLEVQGIPLPRRWRATVAHSGTGSWTYSLYHSVLL